jgi:rhodanese-related sulfurtransferase
VKRRDTMVPLELPQAKQTALGLYVTADEAYERWQAAPTTVKVLDVRTPEEFIHIGHPEMAVNVPLAFQTYRWDPAKGYFDFELNPEFVALVRQIAEPEDEILAMCRSGGRSAMAANLLAKHGFTNVWNMIDGFEGDLVDDRESPHHGKRMQNGWTNSGRPWTYAVDPAQVLLPEDRRGK